MHNLAQKIYEKNSGYKEKSKVDFLHSAALNVYDHIRRRLRKKGTEV